MNEDGPVAKAPTTPSPEDSGAQPAPRGRALRRLMILLGLAIAGVAAAVWAIAIFPRYSPLVNPTSFEVDIHSQTRLDTVYVVVSLVGQSRYQITVYLTTGIRPGAGGHQNEGDLSIYVPGDFPVSCSPGVYCSYQPGYVPSVVGYTTMIEPIIIGGGGDNRQYTMTITDPRFGFAGNNESAVAELPTIEGTGLATATFAMGYNIPNPRGYNWSVPPQVYSTQNLAYWPEGPPANVSNSEAIVQSTEVTGTNPQAQAKDDRDIFISGVLFGVAGGAAIAAVQEGLHMMFDDRDDSRLPKP